MPLITPPFRSDCGKVLYAESFFQQLQGRDQRRDHETPELSAVTHGWPPGIQKKPLSLFRLVGGSASASYDGTPSATPLGCGLPSPIAKFAPW